MLGIIINLINKKINNLNFFNSIKKEEHSNMLINFFKKETDSTTIELTNSINNSKYIPIWFFMGFASGITIKRISFMGLFLVGSTFSGLQFLSYNNYIIINYDKIEKDITKQLDLNDDGKIDKDDLILYFYKIKNILELNLPKSCGYSTGLIFGLRY